MGVVKFLTKRSSKMNEIRNKYHVASISWPNKATKEKAQARARELGLTLSAYVNQLVIADIINDGDFTIRKVKLSEDGEPIDSGHDEDGWQK